MRESLKVKNLNVLNRDQSVSSWSRYWRLRTGLEESTLSVHGMIWRTIPVCLMKSATRQKELHKVKVKFYRSADPSCDLTRRRAFKVKNLRNVKRGLEDPSWRIRGSSVLTSMEDSSCRIDFTRWSFYKDPLPEEKVKSLFTDLHGTALHVVKREPMAR